MTNSRDDRKLSVQKLNCIGQKCPLPVLRLERAFRDGFDEIELMTDDPVSVIDVPIAARAHHANTKMTKLPEFGYVFHIKRAMSS